MKVANKTSRIMTLMMTMIQKMRKTYRIL